MGIIIGLVVTMGCVFGGYMAMGGYINVLIQPWEFVIIGGAAFGTFLVANPLPVIKDTGRGIVEALRAKVVSGQDYLELLTLLHSVMQEIKSKSKAEVEAHIDAPEESEIFKQHPLVLKDHELLNFICDYFRLIMNGNARPHEVEALMEEEIETIRHERLEAVHALDAVGDGLPALGIVAAVLGVVKAMGAIDSSPEILGGLIAAALVGTFLGIFLSYAVMSPISSKLKSVRSQNMRVFFVAKQTLIAFMSGSAPSIALEFGRKAIGGHDRPTLDQVEEAMFASGAGG